MPDESADYGALGAPDYPTLVAVRDTVERHEPLVAETAFDDELDPHVLHVRLSVGFEEPGRFDVRWTVTDAYGFHYSEPGLDFRYDAHPNPHSPRKHFHPPPDAATEDAVPSCIGVDLAERVTLAVLQLWRRAWEADDPSPLNDADDPP